MRSDVALKCTDKAASCSRLTCYGDFKQSNSKGFDLFCSYKQIPTLICNQKAIALEQKKSLMSSGGRIQTMNGLCKPPHNQADR